VVVTFDGSYTPGSWVAVTAAERWLLVDLPLTEPRLADMWQLLRAGAAPEAVLDVLLRDGLTRVPPFALLTASGPTVRIVLRRPATIEITGPSGIERVEATEGTWTDVLVSTPWQSILVLSGSTPDVPVALPLALGMTQAGSLTLTRTAEPGPTPPAVPGDTAERSLADIPGPIAESVAPESEAEPAPDYSALFGGTTDRRAFLDSLLDDERNDSSDVSPAEAERPSGPPQSADDDDPDVLPAPSAEPSQATAVWSGALEAPTGDALIDALPWEAQPTAPPSQPRSPIPVEAPSPALPTQAASGVPVPPPTAPNAPTEPVMPTESDAELDVRTISRAELLASLTSEAPPVGPTVLAVTCPDGHLTPPFATGCRICGRPVDPRDPRRIARPVLGTLRRDDGDAITLDRDVLLGRAPQHGPSDVATQPHLVRIADPGISRNHVQIVLDGWQVLVRDLGSSNGTELELPGESPQKLRAHEDYLAEPGARIILADDVAFTYVVTG
jgi:hypothetical protein